MQVEPLEDILYVENTNEKGTPHTYSIDNLKYKLFIPRAKNLFITTTPAAKSETRTEDEILNANYEKIRNRHIEVYDRFDNEINALDKKPTTKTKYITSLVLAKLAMEGADNWERSNEECLWFQFTDKGDTTPRFYAVVPATSQGAVEQVVPLPKKKPPDNRKPKTPATNGKKQETAAQAMRRMDKADATQSLKEQTKAAKQSLKKQKTVSPPAQKVASIDELPKPPSQDEIFKLPSALDLLYRDSDEEDEVEDGYSDEEDEFSNVKPGDFMQAMLKAGREKEKKGGKIRKSRKMKKSKKTKKYRKTKKGRK